MPAATQPAAPQRRWTAASEETYTQLLRNNSVHGWLHEPHVAYVKHITQRQHQLGIWGAVGEIGVHMGKFLLPLVGFADVSEPAAGFDLFEHEQASNVDKSGFGNKTQVLDNMRRVGLAPGSIHLMSTNSMALNAHAIASLDLPLFRLMSVDGGHSMEVVLHDLMVASCVLADGGVLVVNDVCSEDWVGVNEALMHFSSSQTRLVPFLMGYKKVYFTTPAHVVAYQQMMDAHPQVFTCQSRMHASRRTLAGHAFCYTGPFKIT